MSSGLTFSELVNRPDCAGQFLVEITAIQGGQELVAGGAGPAIMEVPVSGLRPFGGINANDIDLLYSDRFWVGTPTDADKANVEYEDRVATPLVMDRWLPVAPEAARRVQRQFGFIDLINTDGALDIVVSDYAVDGGQVRVLYGPYMAPYSEFETVAEVLGVQFEYNGDKVRLTVRDRTFAISQPLQENFYLGTGGADGTSDVEGKPRPLVYGEVYNISPVPTDPSNLVYQIHDGQMQSVDAVYDEGLALTVDTTVGTSGDAASYAALVAASIGSGKFATCVAEGYIRLGSSPSGLVTADAKGDKTGGTYVDTIGDIAVRIMESKASLPSVQVDAASWAALPTYTCGIYISADESMTGEQVLSFLCGSIGASWGASRSGLIGAYQLVDPSSASADHFFGAEDIVDLRPLHTLIPRWRQPVGYKRNWTVQRGEGLAGAVTDARRQFLKEEYRVEASNDVDIRIRHLEAISPNVMEGVLIDSSDAAAVASDQMALHSADRLEYEITLTRLGWTLDLADVVNVTFDRYGFENSKNVIVRRIREDAERQIIITVWA